jgi:hypothetical protein
MEYRGNSIGQHGTRMKILFAALLLLLSACATTPVSLSDAIKTPPERTVAFQDSSVTHGALVVTRDAGLNGGACYAGLKINGVLAARIDRSEKATFFVPPGDVLLKVERDPLGKGLCGVGQSPSTQRETMIRPGETKHFRLTTNGFGVLDIQRSE